jgi:hypothetical protein
MPIVHTKPKAVKQHKYLFSKTGKPLRLTRRTKEKRCFPEYAKDVKTYIEIYFNLNNHFVRSDYGFAN